VDEPAPALDLIPPSDRPQASPLEDEDLTAPTHAGDPGGPAATLPFGHAGLAPRQAVRDYILISRFAQGGCGDLWEGSQLAFPRTVALKRIREDLVNGTLGDSEYAAQLQRAFLQEALTTAVLEHPNIIPVYDFTLDEEGRPLLSMRLIRGRRWDEMMKEDRRLPQAEYLERHLPIIVSVGNAVAYAHSKGVIHRDLKPSQVMIGEFGEVYLMDWGLALVVDEEKFFSHHPELRHADVVPTKRNNPPLGGTPSYMAPEQADVDATRLSYPTDVFLLGATLYYVLTGCPPRRLGDGAVDSSRLLQVPIVPAVRIRPDWDIPEELDAICRKALQLDPSERQQSVRSLIDAVQGWLTGADKRRESEILTDRTERKLQSVGTDYQALADCESMLTRAIGLWPQNRRAERLLQHTILLYAEAAVGNEDLNLAQALATRLKSARQRDTILNEVRAIESLGAMAESEAEEAANAIRELSEANRRALGKLQVVEQQSALQAATLRGLLEALETLVARMPTNPELWVPFAEAMLKLPPEAYPASKRIRAIVTRMENLARRQGNLAIAERLAAAVGGSDAPDSMPHTS
jgi:serine/threonine protein kinase